MPCNAGYDWCKEHEVVPKDGGERRCVFHAPKGSKGISLEAFNSLVYTEIDKALEEKRPCDLSGTVFEGDISFGNRTFPDISFHHAKFSGKADFNKTIFSGEADFLGATFSGEAAFSWARFSGGADFSGAEFRGEADFMGATFSGKADFRFTTFSSESRTLFYTTKFNREVDFSHSAFSGEAVFVNARFKKAIFILATFFKEVRFDGLFIEDAIVFQGVNLEKASLLHTDLRRCDFIMCKWREKGGRYVLQDEVNFRDSIWKSKGHRRPAKNDLTAFEQKLLSDSSLRIYRIIAVEDLYGTLKRKAKEKNNEFEVSHWHYSEKEMHRERTDFRDEPFNWLVLNLYNLSSGYGENPKKAGLCLLGVLACAYIFISLAGVEPIGAETDKITYLFTDWAKQVVSTGEHLMFRAPTYFKPATVSSSFLKLVFQIFTPIQATLFAFALRNKFRRT